MRFRSDRAKVVVSDLNLAQMQELVVEIKRAGG